ncbi:MAG: Wzz/FepE/Etk N-terminal domain-containing protein [Cyclobacteriaceae bacterium]
MLKEEITKDDEINLFELIQIIWVKRLLVAKVTVISVVVGIFVALTSKVEYQATCKLIPESVESSGPNLGSLGGLAGLAGIDLSSGEGGSLTPELYPQIVKSVPFLLTLIHQPIYFEKIDSITSSYVFLSEIDKPSLLARISEYTIGLPRKIKTLLRSSDDASNLKIEDSMIRLSRGDSRILDNFKSRVTVSVDSETGIVAVSTEMPDAFSAAKIANILVKNLTEQITNYKTQKSKSNLEFTEERYIEAEGRYNSKQRQLAQFTDRNKNITSSLVQTEYQRLQNDFNIAFEVYKGLATQLEQDKIKVKQETPIFTVLEPVVIPFDKAKPKRTLIVIAFTAFGAFIALVVIVFKNLYVRDKWKWEEKS